MVPSGSRQSVYCSAGALHVLVQALADTWTHPSLVHRIKGNWETLIPTSHVSTTTTRFASVASASIKLASITYGAAIDASHAGGYQRPPLVVTSGKRLRWSRRRERGVVGSCSGGSDCRGGRRRMLSGAADEEEVGEDDDKGGRRRERNRERVRRRKHSYESLSPEEDAVAVRRREENAAA
ncbi:hypothetical protein BHE74_00029355 [Ensete ventricosum]|nr:hypothetical protein BHE74_00029355 [Ensete ventricosum]